MNPQNRGQHIKLRHSSLWRNSMFISKPVQETDSCHKQLNQLGTTGRSWRERDVFIKTNYSYLGRSSLQKSFRSSKLSEALNYDKKQTSLTKSFIQSIEKEADRLDRNKKLVDGMSKLKQMNLLSAKQLNEVKFPGIIKVQHVYNDYHERVANPGFSRNYMGKHYTK